MENFKLHEDAIELTEKYSAYQLAKMLLKSNEELASATNKYINFLAKEDTLESHLVDNNLLDSYAEWVNNNDLM